MTVNHISRRVWLRLAVTGAFGIASMASSNQMRGQNTAPVAAYVVAHPDDWQLFMGDDAFTDVSSGQLVIFVYLTAGGADRPPAYWRARERGAAASVYAAANFGRQVPAEGAESSCGTVDVRGHHIARCGYRNTVSYYLRLPDGNRDGTGFPATRSQSLAKLRTAPHVRIEAVDSSAAYESWDDLSRTVRSLVEMESSTTATSLLQLHSHDPDSLQNKGDHSDHLNTGLLAQDLASEIKAHLTQYTGYDIGNRPPNLPTAAVMAKALLFMAYDRQRLQANESWSAYAEAPKSYSLWLFRTYSRPAARQ